MNDLDRTRLLIEQLRRLVKQSEEAQRQATALVARIDETLRRKEATSRVRPD